METTQPRFLVEDRATGAEIAECDTVAEVEAIVAANPGCGVSQYDDRVGAYVGMVGYPAG